LFWIMNFRENGKDLGHVRMSLAEYSQRIRATDSILADPGFPALANLTAEQKKTYSMDLLFKAGPLDFPDFFATNPELIKRGIGLQPDVFQDFKFETKAVKEDGVSGKKRK